MRKLSVRISPLGDFEIDPANYARGFIELELERDMSDLASGLSGTLSVTPSVFCEVDGTSRENECGYGASLGYTGATLGDGSSWSIAVDYEQTASVTSTSARADYTRSIMKGAGVSRSSLGLASGGTPQVEQSFEFSW